MGHSLLKNILFLLVFAACTGTTRQHGDTRDASDSIAVRPIDSLANKEADTTAAHLALLEIFVDSLEVGKKGHTKFELIKHRVFDDVYAIVKCYTRGPHYWYHQNTFFHESNSLRHFECTIADYNNDGYKDFTVISILAARSANEVRRLFIYEPEEKKFIAIKNAEDYPNMQYNAELDCIDALLVHGGSTTVFARIEGDSLKTFARVDNSDHLTVSVYDKNGKEQVIRKDATGDGADTYTRYKNYKPLTPY